LAYALQTKKKKGAGKKVSTKGARIWDQKETGGSSGGQRNIQFSTSLV